MKMPDILSVEFDYMNRFTNILLRLILMPVMVSSFIIIGCASNEENEMAIQRRMIEEYFSPKMYGDIATQARKNVVMGSLLDP